LIHAGDIIILYSDGVYDGSDEEDRLRIERIVRDHKEHAAREICKAILDYATNQDERSRQMGQEDRVDDKTAFIIKHS
jgi:serine phosphatase RsbU (regulator of sigma subunit)